MENELAPRHTDKEYATMTTSRTQMDDADRIEEKRRFWEKNEQ